MLDWLLFDEFENDDDEELVCRRIIEGEVPPVPLLREPKLSGFCCREPPKNFGCSGLVAVGRPNPAPLIADLLTCGFENPPAGAEN